MVKDECWEPFASYATAEEELMAKFETSKENREKFMKEKKEKMNAKAEAKSEKRATDINEFIVAPITEKVQETIDEIVTSTAASPKDKEEKLEKWQNVVTKVIETTEAVEEFTKAEAEGTG
jgi:hypothetical protein